MGEAQIILSHSPESGLVAIASGEQYPWARTNPRRNAVPPGRHP